MIFAIGDIHGQASMLQASLWYLENNLLKKDDTVVFLGDYIDRGSDSKGVLEMLRAFRERHPQTVFLRGNHEELFLNAYEDVKDDEELWLSNGGWETLQSYGAEWLSSWRESIPQTDLDFIRATQIEHVASHYHFVHAGLPPESWSRQGATHRDARLWIRGEFIDSDQDFGRIVIFGHTPQRSMRPLVMRNKIGIDTAAVFGGRLTVAGFDDSQSGEDLHAFILFQVDKHGEIVGQPKHDSSAGGLSAGRRAKKRRRASTPK